MGLRLGVFVRSGASGLQQVDAFGLWLKTHGRDTRCLVCAPGLGAPNGRVDATVVCSDERSRTSQDALWGEQQMPLATRLWSDFDRLVQIVLERNGGRKSTEEGTNQAVTRRQSLFRQQTGPCRLGIGCG